MKLLSLQDNFSKVKAVQDTFQQLLNFPDAAQQAMASELTKRQELRRKQVLQSEGSEGSKTEEKKKAEKEGIDQEFRGRKRELAKPLEGELRQCTIDFRV